MGYREQFDKAKSANAVKSLSAKYVEWKEVGQQIIGELVAKNPVHGQLGGSDYNQYLFNTDDGMVKFALGRASDTEAGAMMQAGGVYSITYGGQEKLKGGRKINRFDVVEVIAPDDVVVGGDKDIPI